MPVPLTVSLIIVACDDAARLRECILHTRPHVDQVVVAVQESADETLVVARELADVVVQGPCHGHPEPSRPAACAAAAGDWLLLLDADERLSPWARQQLRAWTADPTCDFYFLRELTLIDGRPMEDALHGRLFRAGLGIVGTTLHRDNQPAPGARARRLRDQVAIEHFKTRAEQAADDARYARLAGAKNEAVK